MFAGGDGGESSEGEYEDDTPRGIALASEAPKKKKKKKPKKKKKKRAEAEKVFGLGDIA